MEDKEWVRHLAQRGLLTSKDAERLYDIAKRLENERPRKENDTQDVRGCPRCGVGFGFRCANCAEPV